MFGSRLFVDGKTAACNSEVKFPTSSKEKEYRLPLKSGDHEILLEFCHTMENHLWKSCIFSWQPPGEVKAVIVNGAAHRREPGARGFSQG